MHIFGEGQVATLHPDGEIWAGGACVARLCEDGEVYSYGKKVGSLSESGKTSGFFWF